MTPSIAALKSVISMRRSAARWPALWLLATVALCVLAPQAARAGQRALLVGVGKYAMPGIDLPGIDLDIERVREMLNRMGFDNSQIHTLMDEQATSTNVIAEMSGWLRRGVKPTDRVVFYFSGHGSSVPDFSGDEEDGLDEVLVTHDMHRARVNNRATLAGVVVDDKIGELLDAIPSRNILVLVDSCHSGTITRSFNLKSRSLGSDPVYVKSFNYPGMPLPRVRGITRGMKAGIPKDAHANYVALTAATDNEQAIGTSHGGVFTIGLTEAVARLSSEGKTITVRALRDEVTQYIGTKVDKDQAHHPQINGNLALADENLAIVPATAAVVGPNRQKLQDLVAAQAQKLELQATKARYAVDEPVKLTVAVPGSGYLNVVTVDPKDVATVLYPNRHHEGNAVTAGSVTIPAADMEFELLASEPLGPTYVYAFFSTDPVNFFQETLDDRDHNGAVTVDFPALSHSATRAIRVVPRKSQVAAGTLQIEIVAAAGAKN